VPKINYVPSRRTVHVVWYVAAALLVVLVAWLIWMVVVTSQRLDVAESTRADREAQVVELVEQQANLSEAAEHNSQIAEALAQQVRRLGERPVAKPEATPEPFPGPPGEPGQRGPMGPSGPAPSAAEIQSAVAVYCASGRCDGRDPTATQVAAAVATYCDGRGECRGPAGSDGQDGADGRNGEDGAPGADGRDGADGSDAPPPSQAQVDQAVATYCDARGGCRGPKGDRGEPGTDGRDGQDAVPFTFSFTVQVNPVQQQTYTCTVTAPDQTVTCSSDE
jgi:hypothetical protein